LKSHVTQTYQLTTKHQPHKFSCI